MNDSCIHHENTISDSTSISFVSKQVSPPVSLIRMGSVTSAVLDLDGSTEAESGHKLPSSRFKGVVPQPNGRWGAQIYETHQRVWLGTFSEEAEAARAYDAAVQRFRGRHAVTNFNPLVKNKAADEVESMFLNTHSKAEIVDMLRKHTYNDELEQARRNISTCQKSSTVNFLGFDLLMRTTVCLFEKAVTSSDVGKLNRLVIPKQHAEEHLPLQNGSRLKGVILNLKDVNGKVWRFRYSYWNSSQSYVLTKGWSRFVKEMNLKVGDVVSFHRSTGPDKQLFIDWKAKNGSFIEKLTEPVPVRLFGVDIFEVPVTGNKRMSKMELFTLRCKKTKSIGFL